MVQFESHYQNIKSQTTNFTALYYLSKTQTVIASQFIFSKNIIINF